MAYLDPDIAAFQAAGEMNLGKQQLEQQRLAQLSQEARYYEQQRMAEEQQKLAQREKEKAEYAKWEREQILNQVASELYADRKAVGDFAGGNSSEGLSPLSAAEQYLAAAKEAARRGKGAYAQEFLAQGQQLAAKEQQAKLDAEETRLKNDKLKEEAAALRNKNEAKSRDASDIIESTDSMGNVRLIDKTTGEVFKTIEGAGKPSATFEKTQAAKQKMGGDIDFAISKLEEATKEGGLIDQSTGSGAGALLDTAAGFFGHATEGSIAAGAMAPVYDLVLKMVPRFEGPQSDKDTQSYRDAAGNLANPAMPNEKKKAAAAEILKIMKARRGQFVGAEVQGTEADQPSFSVGAPPPGAVRRKN